MSSEADISKSKVRSRRPSKMASIEMKDLGRGNKNSIALNND